jgi:hypothetical protein
MTTSSRSSGEKMARTVLGDGETRVPGGKHWKIILLILFFSPARKKHQQAIFVVLGCVCNTKNLGKPSTDTDINQRRKREGTTEDPQCTLYKLGGCLFLLGNDCVA